MENFTKSFVVSFIVAILTITLFETTKSVHAANYKLIGNNILKVAKR